MPSGIAVASSGEMSVQAVDEPLEVERGQRRGRSSLAAAVTSAGSMNPPIQPIAVPEQQRGEADREVARQPHAGEEADQDDDRSPAGRSTAPPTSARAGRIEMKVMEMPASVPSIAARACTCGCTGRRRRRARMIRPMMNAQARPGRPGLHRVLGRQVRRQHDHERHDEHVRHARPVGHRGDVGALLAPGELAREVEVEDVADQQLRCRARAAGRRRRRRRACARRRGRARRARAR